MLVVIDKHDPSPFDNMCNFLEKEDGIHSQILYDPKQAMDYINNHGLKDHVFFIHGSLGTSSIRFEQDETISQELIEIVHAIREKNIYAPVVIFSGASDFPLKRMITDLQVDGYFSNLVRLEEFEELAIRGEVTPEEMKERGRTVENISLKRRETGATAYYRPSSRETSE